MVRKRVLQRRETIKRRKEKERQQYEARLEDMRHVAKWLRANFWVSSTGMVESKHVKAVVCQAMDKPNVAGRFIGQCVRFAFPDAENMTAGNPKTQKPAKYWGGITYRQHNKVISARTLKRRAERQKKLLEDDKEKRRTQKERRKSRRTAAAGAPS